MKEGGQAKHHTFLKKEWRQKPLPRWRCSMLRLEWGASWAPLWPSSSSPALSPSCLTEARKHKFKWRSSMDAKKCRWRWRLDSKNQRWEGLLMRAMPVSRSATGRGDGGCSTTCPGHCTLGSNVLSSFLRWLATNMEGRMSCISTGDGSLMDATFQGMMTTCSPSIFSSILLLSTQKFQNIWRCSSRTISAFSIAVKNLQGYFFFCFLWKQ